MLSETELISTLLESNWHSVFYCVWWTVSCGRSPSIDGLPTEFYKTFWTLLGKDLMEVFQRCLDSGTLPLSCTRVVLTLLPKKGDLGLLQNWRPISLLCTDYKILAKYLSNECLDMVVHASQTYCVPERTIMDNLFLLGDIIDSSQLLAWLTPD